MTKFKLGDKVRIKDRVSGYDQLDYSSIFTYGVDDWDYTINEYPDDFELVEEIHTEDTSKRHVHHDMIIEWAKDPSRAVQWRDNEACIWQDCSDDDVNPYPVWDVNVQYRFKPKKPERVFPVTSLGIKELASHIISEHETVCFDSLVAVANAAIKQYILDTESSKGNS